MRAILYNPKKKTFEEVEIGKGLEDYYKFLECRTFDVQTNMIKGFQVSCYVDDEGTFISGNLASESIAFQSVLIGNILFLGGVDYETGNTLPLPEEVSKEYLDSIIEIIGEVE